MELPLSNLWSPSLRDVMYKKAMKKKEKKVSKIAKGKLAKSVVSKDDKEMIATVLKKTDLMKTKKGKFVSRMPHDSGKKDYAHYIKDWTTAYQNAHKDISIKVFVAIKKSMNSS
mmetsp:Transcript_20954/g.33447  ORF Transcript_20954/g.33447 Transcript_20954/m.33447 type:complete len:114 (+) Transcript_20954:66-407(+)